jgi:hypothetical protein
VQLPQESPPVEPPLHEGALPSALLHESPPPSEPLHESPPSELLHESLLSELLHESLPSLFEPHESPEASLPLLQAPSPAALRLLPSQRTVTFDEGCALAAVSVSLPTLPFWPWLPP